MILAHHLIFVLYGWWLPNDPRGSTSRAIRCDLIAELGELHFGRKKLQPASHAIREFYERARQILKHELKTLDSRAVAIVGQAIAQLIRQRRYTCYACAIMPDHVHLVMRKHRDRAEEMIEHVQHASAEALHITGLWPQDHPVWGGPGWKVFLDSAADIRRTIPYVENNPMKIGLSKQDWDFITTYDGWTMAGAAR